MIVLKVRLEYGENILVAVIFRDKWSWYITEKEYWFLDLVKLEQAYLAKGYQLPDQGNYAYRYHIGILDEHTAERFLDEIRDFQVSTVELRELLLHTVEMESDVESPLADYLPVLLVHFDEKYLISAFPEPASFEYYVPAGWVGTYESFLDRVPSVERYWITNNKNYFL